MGSRHVGRLLPTGSHIGKIGSKSPIPAYRCNTRLTCQTERTLPIGGSALMSLEDVWAALPTHEWVSCEALRESSGLDKESLSRVIKFLVKYEFVDARNNSGLYVKRKNGKPSPMVTINLLRSLASNSPVQESAMRPGIIAERVACKTCGSRYIKPIDKNQVECSNCHEHQWHFIQHCGTTPLACEGHSKARTRSIPLFLRKLTSGRLHV